jgi:hypothetical protein
VSLQRSRSTIWQRKLLRLSLAAFRREGMPVWLGYVSRDVGAKGTIKFPTLRTDIIDPNIDETR